MQPRLVNEDAYEPPAKGKGTPQNGE